jgi:hypothetical protein
VPEAAKARGRKGADSQKQNLKVRGVHSVFTAQRYQKWLKTGVVARPKQIDLLHPKEMVKNQPQLCVLSTVTDPVLFHSKQPESNV